MPPPKSRGGTNGRAFGIGVQLMRLGGLAPCRGAADLARRARSGCRQHPIGGGASLSNMATLTKAPSIVLAGSALAATRSTSFGAQSSMEDFRIITNVKAGDVPPALRRDCVLFYAPDCKELAEKIAQASDGAVRLGNIRWK